MADEIEFKPPILKDLRNNPGSVQFATVDDLERWIGKERQQWERVMNAPSFV